MFESEAPLSNPYSLALMSGISWALWPLGTSLDASGIGSQACGDWGETLGLVNIDLSQPFNSRTRLPCSPVHRSFYLVRQPSIALYCELHGLAIVCVSQSTRGTSCDLLPAILFYEETSGKVHRESDHPPLPSIIASVPALSIVATSYVRGRR